MVVTPARANASVIDLRARHRTVAVVGLGYVGLPTALAFADAGLETIGVDVDERRLAAIDAGRVDLVRADHDRLARLLPTISLTRQPAVVHAADAVVICVPTPIDHRNDPDLRALRAACADVVDHARRDQVIILTSTTYVGCTRDLLVDPLAARGLHAGDDICVAFSPERIDPANTTVGQESVPRVVGGVTERCGDVAADVLSRIAPVHRVSSIEAAEMTKLHENVFRAVNIALANELADTARTLGLDAVEIVEAASTKPYGFMRFDPGPGVGGHCIPCDPHYLLWQLRGDEHTPTLVQTAMSEIAARPSRVVDRAAQLLSDDGRGLGGARVLVVGAAYKPGVEDTRESPALAVLAALQRRGAHVDYHDPLVSELQLADGTTLSSAPPSVVGHDLVVVLTLHPGQDRRWLEDAPRVLDATYRLQELANAVSL